MQHNHITTVDRNTNLAHFHQDGLLDIFAGCFVTLGGLGLMLGMVYLVAIAPAIYLPIWSSLRQRVTKPRLGDLTPPRNQSLRFQFFGFGMFIAGILFLLLVLAGTVWGNRVLPAWLANIIHQHTLLMIGIFLAGFIAMIAALLGVKRFYAYAALALVLFLAGNALDLDFELILIAFGILIICAGFITLFRFTQHYPSRNEREH